MVVGEPSHSSGHRRRHHWGDRQKPAKRGFGQRRNRTRWWRSVRSNRSQQPISAAESNSGAGSHPQPASTTAPFRPQDRGRPHRRSFRAPGKGQIAESQAGQTAPSSMPRCRRHRRQAWAGRQRRGLPLPDAPVTISRESPVLDDGSSHQPPHRSRFRVVRLFRETPRGERGIAAAFLLAPGECADDMDRLSDWAMPGRCARCWKRHARRKSSASRWTRMPICRGLGRRIWSKQRSVDDEDAALDLPMTSEISRSRRARLLWESQVLGTLPQTT